jgi:hypothetical protein
VPAANIAYLAEQTDRDPARISDRSTWENIQRTLGDIAGRAGPDDQVYIVLIGHGSVRDGAAKFSLPGPDPTASDFADLLQLFPTQTLVFVNAASASGDFIAALSAEGRAVITATRSGRERTETLFARFLVEAYATDGADVDKDERVSVLEAFNYARREVARVYESENRLLSEHALLDDDGDGQGTGEPGLGAEDGQLAATLFLSGSSEPRVLTGEISDPRLAQMYAEKRALEEQVAALRQRKEEMDTATYEQELERLLLALALKNREIRELEGEGPR